MSDFSSDNYMKKLTELNNSQQSIQSLSLWLVHHRKHSKVIVDLWLKELRKGKPSKKLTFLYLANDIVQTSRKKGPEYNRDFKDVLPVSFTHTAKYADEKVKGSMTRIISIWKERKIFDDKFIMKMNTAMNRSNSPRDPGQQIRSALKNEASGKSPIVRAVKSPSTRSVSFEAVQQKKKKEVKMKSETAANLKKKKKSEISLLEEVDRELEKGTTILVPQPELLIKAMEELVNSASADAKVREKIASFPPEVSDISLLDKLTDRDSAEKLSVKVNEAHSLLTDYNIRLAAELEERKRVAVMLKLFIDVQKEDLIEARDDLTERRSILMQVASLRKELKSHLSNLPDMTLLPDVMGLGPLLSASDLFGM